MASLNEFSLVAPCGMNCGICRAYLREKNKCPGCRGDDTNKPVTRVRCKIKNCEVFKNGELACCFECEDFPCQNLKHLDKRYRTRYNMSMIENLQKLRFCCAENFNIFERLENIKKWGIEKFLENEDLKWTCSECGGTICVHTGYCYSCEKNKSLLKYAH